MAISIKKPSWLPDVRGGGIVISQVENKSTVYREEQYRESNEDREAEGRKTVGWSWVGKSLIPWMHVLGLTYSWQTLNKTIMCIYSIYISIW